MSDPMSNTLIFGIETSNPDRSNLLALLYTALDGEDPNTRINNMVYTSDFTSGFFGNTDSPFTNGPTAIISKAPDIYISGATTYEFSVTYADSVAIDLDSIDSRDIRVENSRGFSQLATRVAASDTTDRTLSTVTVAYRITPPGGVWDRSDNHYDFEDHYKITLLADQVANASGNYAQEEELGAFGVNIPEQHDFSFSSVL
jgi:hypothetical protein